MVLIAHPKIIVRSIIRDKISICTRLKFLLLLESLKQLLLEQLLEILDSLLECQVAFILLPLTLTPK